MGNKIFARLDVPFSKDQLVYTVNSFSNRGNRISTLYYSNGKQFWTYESTPQNAKSITLKFYKQEELLDKYTSTSNQTVRGSTFKSVIERMVKREEEFHELKRVLDQCLLSDMERTTIYENQKNKLILLKSTWNTTLDTLCKIDSSKKFNSLVNDVNIGFQYYFEEEANKLDAGTIVDNNCGMLGMITIIWQYVDSGIDPLELSVY